MSTFRLYSDIYNINSAFGKNKYFSDFSDSKITVTDGKYSMSFTGNFDAESSSPNGTITGFSISYKGKSLFTVSDFRYTFDDVDAKGVDNTILSFSGNDKIYGSTNSDEIDGENGNDTIYGDRGNDIISGGKGKDSLFGGAGADTFVFSKISETNISKTSCDIINDYKRSDNDKIDLSDIDARASSSINNSFSFVNNFNPRSDNSGKIYYNNTEKVLYGSTDYDATAEFAIKVDLTGINSSNFHDFIIM